MHVHSRLSFGVWLVCVPHLRECCVHVLFRFLGLLGRFGRFRCGTHGVVGRCYCHGFAGGGFRLPRLEHYTGSSTEWSVALQADRDMFSLRAKYLQSRCVEKLWETIDSATTAS